VEAVLEGWDRYVAAFTGLTRRAHHHFRRRDWPALRADADARLLLYGREVAAAVVRLGQLAQWRPLDPALLRRRVAAALAGRPDAELARTFHNSVVRRVLGTVGADPATEFLDLDAPRLDETGATLAATWNGPGGLEAILGRALAPVAPGAEWAGGRPDAAAVARRVARDLPGAAAGGELAVVPAPFLRGKRAFVVGRVRWAGGTAPLIVPVVHTPGGLRVDAVVTSPDEASMIFGFTRTYFQVDLPAPGPAVAFLRSLLPGKRLDELYTVLGHHKHGKREFYQELVRVLTSPGVRFEPAEGVRGMVMVVFGLPPMNVVFKVIRDRAAPPKQVTRAEVRARYEFVFRQEYGGRLADTQEFEDLALPAGAFAPAVREELLAEAGETVRREGAWLVFAHVYTERRMTPLDLFLREAPPEAARAAVVDFGQAIRDLAGIAIFPGDMLAKNFGVTRHGRVVFYDYDEVVPLDSCTFRAIPPPRTEEEELAPEPWFPVREGDVFPEEFERFLRFPDPLHGHFLARHRDLFSAAWWRAVQDRVRREGLREPAPYPARRRLDGPETTGARDGSRAPAGGSEAAGP
jgi:isocitrate dehydrogenase kinase/phosphatase